MELEAPISYPPQQFAAMNFATIRSNAPKFRKEDNINILKIYSYGLKPNQEQPPTENRNTITSNNKKSRQR
ncbi:hypothetical protein TSUD_153710 [Trifolium subterraneum]|uniref:Uncharacterized protein n=1 Tax=Trifolium subterraneum TaxID=3900 RepID=A0A2Z6MZ24_TRISU|nr:hypothetical protein TSUD_153710 [Trifolium subterraneum]